MVAWLAVSRFLTRLTVPRADMSIVFSSSQVDILVSAFGAGTPVTMIPFCVDTNFYKPSPPTCNDDYVLSMGRDSGRNFQIVVDAVRGSDIKLTLRTNNSVNIQAEVDTTVTLIHQHLSWIDYRDLYVNSAIVVVAADETPNASGVTSLLEAMAMGKPVIVTATAPLRDYLPPVDAGIVVSVGDHEAIRDAIVSLMADRSRRFTMGKRAREFVLQNFSPEAHFIAVGKALTKVIT